jgi:hypothetical protein
MPILNAIELGAGAPAEDAPGLLGGAVHAAVAAHYDAASHAFAYAAFANSREFAALRAAARALAAFDSAALHIGLRLAFWLNVYNALVLHAIVARRARGGVRALGDFFSASAYVVGGHAFTLDEIEHGLLRVNAPRMGFGGAPLARNDPRRACTPYVFDDRVHFAMYSACRSSPPPRAYRAEGLDAALEVAARAYLGQHVRVEDGGATLVVPKVFDWYAADFGGEDGVRQFVIARLRRDEDVAAIDAAGGRPRLRYVEFDWSLNAP